jgi:hypothetical protein
VAFVWRKTVVDPRASYNFEALGRTSLVSFQAEYASVSWSVLLETAHAPSTYAVVLPAQISSLHGTVALPIGGGFSFDRSGPTPHVGGLYRIRHSRNVATALPPSTAGIIASSSCDTPSRFVAYSSRSTVVPGGEKVNCCRTISR